MTAEEKRTSKQYYAHHTSCPTCVAAGQGYGQRCFRGSVYWKDYQKASKQADLQEKQTAS